MPFRRLALARRTILGAALLALASLSPAATLSPAAALSPVEVRDAVVVIGTSGLSWSDLDPETTPALWSLTQGAAIGGVITRSVRTAACPADGWLALGAGQRSADAPSSEGCRTLSEPADDGVVPHWATYVTERDNAPYGARLGLLGEILAAHDRVAVAIGSGAAIALATPDGIVERYVPVPSDAEALAAAVTAAQADADLVVVDVGNVTETDRAAQVAAVEQRVAPLLAELSGTTTRVMLASLADAGPAPRMQVLALRGFSAHGADPATTVLRSASTRQDGYVLVTDLLPTLLDVLELDAPAGTLVGSTADGVPAGATGTARIAGMTDLERHSSAIQTGAPVVLAVLVALNVALLATAWLMVARGTARRGRWLRIAAVAVGAFPAAAFLANLVTWWRADQPAVALLATVVAGAALLTGVALLGPWRRAALGPLTVIAAITALTIIVDVVTGSRLQLGSPLGVHPLVAGRFYGINNSAFALLMVSSLLVAAVASAALLARGRRAAAVAVVAGIGALVTVVDGMPGLGADFGGPPAIVPAFAVLGLLVAGVRVGWRRLVVVLLAGAIVVSTFAVIDWSRPAASRTHLGRFVQTVLDGGLADVIGRKVAQNLAILAGSWFVILAVVVIALIVWLVGRSGQSGPDARRQLRAARDELRSLGTELTAWRLAWPAVVTGLAVGLVLNDSGIAIPALGGALALPLVIATLSALRTDRSRAGEPSAP